MSDKISDAQLSRIAQAEESDVGGAQSPIVTAMALELIARRAADVKPIGVRQAIANMENHDYCHSINVAYKYGWNDAIKAAGGTIEG